jgi:hypothetical protein
MPSYYCTKFWYFYREFARAVRIRSHQPSAMAAELEFEFSKKNKNKEAKKSKKATVKKS